MENKVTTLKGKLFTAVSPIEDFLMNEAKNFHKEGNHDGVEIAAIILPLTTKIEFEKGKGCWSIFVFEDKQNKNRTQKMLTLGISEGRIFEIEIPGQGVYMLSFNGKDVKFQSSSVFNRDEFNAESKKNIDELDNIRNSERKAKEEAERKVKQSASVEPFVVDFDNPPVSVKPVVFVKSSKKDLTKTNAGDETYKPFAGKLNPQKLAKKDLEEDFNARFEEDSAVNK